jgi:hypothetical protein
MSRGERVAMILSLIMIGAAILAVLAVLAFGA